jgi:hypothetical protein
LIGSDQKRVLKRRAKNEARIQSNSRIQLKASICFKSNQHTKKRWPEPYQGRQKGEAKERLKDAQPQGPKKTEAISLKKRKVSYSWPL